MLAVALLLLLTAGCGDGGADPTSGPSAEGGPRTYPYQITTTTAMITDIVRQVAGDKAAVTGLMAEGVDPHLYRPTSRDMARLQSADVVFYNGLMLEGKMSDVLVKLARTRPIFAVTELLDLEGYVMTDPLQHYDPHVWMDVRGWIHAVRAVAESLAEYDPAGAADYQANAERYIQDLEKLDAYARQVIGSIPEQQRVLVTAHDAFGYLGRAYGIKVRGVQGLSTESQASVRDVEELVNFLVDNRIQAVFVETSVPAKQVESLVQGAEARGHQVRIGGSLFSDAMGAPGTYEGTYIGMIDHNVTTIARELGGQAPERGMLGKLKSGQE